MTTPVHPAGPQSLRAKIYELIEFGRGRDLASQAFDALIVGLIVLNIAAFVAETVPELNDRWHGWFTAIEVGSVAIFTVEYIARLWTSVEMPILSRMSPWRARLTYARSPALVIDLLAILPFYLGLVFASLGFDLRILRALRLLRFFKLMRYSPAIDTLLRVLRSEARSLVGAGLLLLVALLFSSVGMYLIEGAHQPDKFGNVPNAAYWAMTTLTTVGYGDVVPITPLGKLWAMLTMLVGLTTLALPVAIIATGFAQEVGRRDFVLTWSMMAHIPMFAGLRQDQVTHLMALLHAHHLPPGFEIIRAGADADAMYFIAAGHVRMEMDGHNRDYHMGDAFGVAGFVDGTTHGGTYMTVSRVRLLKLYRDDFRALEQAVPQLAAHLRSLAADRRRRLGEARPPSRGKPGTA